ncbi:MAG: hypothetical protein V2A58_07900 [Planctomycetota bacterium]
MMMMSPSAPRQRRHEGLAHGPLDDPSRQGEDRADEAQAEQIRDPHRRAGRRLWPEDGDPAG